VANATDQQVQTFVNERIRTVAESARALKITLDDHIAAIGDVYAALTQASPTWADSRGGGVPHLLTPADVLAINTFMNNVRDAIQNNAQYPVVLKACVQPPKV
jgi:hypothetical protein